VTDALKRSQTNASSNLAVAVFIILTKFYKEDQLNKHELPQNIIQKVKDLEDKPDYLNRDQIAMACGVTTKTIGNWHKHMPKHDDVIGLKKYWRTENIMPFILEYRKTNAPK